MRHTFSTVEPIVFNGKTLVSMEQIHGDVVVEVMADSKRAIGADAIVSRDAGVALVVRTADCLPVLLYHPSGVIGAVHAGRKGTKKQILQKTLQRLKSEFGIVDGLEVWFGPAICVDCYQVDRETDEHYNLIEKNLEQVFAEFQPEQIKLEIMNDCTCHNPKLHSYRREGKGVPMNYSVIAL